MDVESALVKTVSMLIVIKQFNILIGLFQRPYKYAQYIMALFVLKI